MNIQDLYAFNDLLITYHLQSCLGVFVGIFSFLGLKLSRFKNGSTHRTNDRVNMETYTKNKVENLQNSFSDSTILLQKARTDQKENDDASEILIHVKESLWGIYGKVLAQGKYVQSIYPGNTET